MNIVKKTSGNGGQANLLEKAIGFRFREDSLTFSLKI
jgi:hypothetical protein